VLLLFEPFVFVSKLCVRTIFAASPTMDVSMYASPCRLILGSAFAAIAVPAAMTTVATASLGVMFSSSQIHSRNMVSTGVNALSICTKPTLR